MGFGDSDKLDPSFGDDRYFFDAQRHYMFSFWDKLDLGQEVILVLHDCGSMFGFDWARQNSERVKAIIHMESIAALLVLEDFPASLRPNVLEMLEQIEKGQFDDMSSIGGVYARRTRIHRDGAGLLSQALSEEPLNR